MSRLGFVLLALATALYGADATVQRCHAEVYCQGISGWYNGFTGSSSNYYWGLIARGYGSSAVLYQFDLALKYSGAAGSTSDHVTTWQAADSDASATFIGVYINVNNDLSGPNTNCGVTSRSTSPNTNNDISTGTPHPVGDVFTFGNSNAECWVLSARATTLEQVQ